ncbi:MAG: hypothetical protein KDJ27_03450 [Gammaproteobacteria bacterium]|nr:hypothetical protein [Gammaproteobacteria bacterium]MCB1922794.1 hypothetical protein [Gammaproteobacteria bacterium]
MFVLLAVVCVVALVALASGRLRVDSELLGLGVGAVLVLLLWIALRRR